MAALVLEWREVRLVGRVRPINTFNRYPNLLPVGWRARMVCSVLMKLSFRWMLDHGLLNSWLTVTKSLVAVAASFDIFLLKLLLNHK